MGCAENFRPESFDIFSACSYKSLSWIKRLRSRKASWTENPIINRKKGTDRSILHHPGMAAWTLWSLDLQERLQPPHQNILDQIKRAEKRMFPRKEAFDFDTELKKRNAQLTVVLDTTKSASYPLLAAYAVYVYTPSVALLHKVCVLEDYRRRGIAKKMLLSQHERLAHRGCGRIQLWVDEHRSSARQLYESISFETVGRVEDYYGPNRPALRMILQL